jgi:hypothetical protein
MDINHVHSLIRLSLLGDVVKLKIKFNKSLILSELEPFKNDWKQYNPRKQIRRMGLSITSYDGLLSGIPDLDSLLEFNASNNVDYRTEDCNIFTPVYSTSSELKKIIDPIKPNVGRSHFLKLNAGGFFPEHRDSYGLDSDGYKIPDVIRLIGFVKNCNSSSFKFIINDKLITFEEGTMYYFNSMMPHSLFSFNDDCIMIVMVVKFDCTIYNYIISNLAQR